MSVEIELWFSDEARPSLDRTCFRFPGDPEVNAVRGKDTGAYPGTYTTFQWTRAVKALIVFLLKWAYFARQTTRSGSATPPEFKGERGTLAAALSNAISRKTPWLAAIFGGKRVAVVLDSYIKRSNADFKRSGPVLLSLNEGLFPAGNISVNWDDKRIGTSSEMASLLDRLLKTCASKVDLHDNNQEHLAAPGPNNWQPDSLPLMARSPNVSDNAQIARITETATTRCASKKTILVVEDEDGPRRAIVGILQKMNHQAVGVEDGPRALEFLGQSVCDLIVLDLCLNRDRPDWLFLDRLWEVIRCLKTRIVAMTGKQVSDTDAFHLRAKGVVDYIRKDQSNFGREFRRIVSRATTRHCKSELSPKTKR